MKNATRDGTLEAPQPGFAIEALAPAHVRAIAPYVPGKPIAETARELGIPEASILMMASNESPLGASPRAPSRRCAARSASCTTTPTAATST